MRKCVKYICCALVLFPLLSPGQMKTAISFDRLSTENIIKVRGLSQNSITSMIMDSEGFMWFGTWDGLNRYDAYTFSIYRIENGLSHNTIRCILEDYQGYLWIGTDNGLNRLRRSTSEITVFRNDPEDPNSLCQNTINAIYQDSDSNLWIGTSAGLCTYNPRIRIFSSIDLQITGFARPGAMNVTRIIESGTGMLWISTYHGIFSINTLDGKRKHYPMADTADNGRLPGQNMVEDMIMSKNGQIWIATQNGLYKIDPVVGIPEAFQPGGNQEQPFRDMQVTAILEDAVGSYWIGTSQGLFIYDPKTNSLEHYKAGSTLGSLSNDDILSIYQDPSGTIWIGTYSGLNKVDNSPSRFEHYFQSADIPGSLTNNIVYAINEDADGKLWIGTFGGINILDRRTGQISVMKHDPSNRNSLSGNKIRNIIRDSQGMIWIGTELAGLNRYDPKTGRFTHFLHNPQDPSSLPDNNIYVLMEDSKKRIWIGTPRGLRIYDPESQVFMPISIAAGKSIRLSGDLIWAITEDRDGTFWIGTTQGLNLLSPGLQHLTIFRHEPGNPSSLNNNSVFSVFQDRSGMFWIGTMGGGLNRYDPASGKFKAYTDKEGLPNNVVYGMLEDEEGNLWLSTNGGICKFIIGQETFVTYDAKDGIQGNEFNMGAHFKNSRGEMFFGGMNGLNVFYPGNIKVNTIPPKVVFTSLSIFNEKVNRNIIDGDTLILRPSENFFSIGFSALDYTNPSKNWYRFKLEGFDHDWVIRDAGHRWADYMKINPGTYTFRVSGTNNDGIWNPEGISLVIIVQPPWYSSWLFRISSSVLIISLIWSFIYLRFRTIRRKHEVEKKVLSVEKQVFELEQKALRLQMNPHFIFNSLNAIQNFVISNDTDKAVNYLAKFSHLMRMILANSTASYISLKDELKALVHYMDLEKLRFDNKFEYSIETDPNIDQEFMEIPPMLLQPYVENAIIHGIVHSDKPGLLELKLRLENDTLICIIQDNGVGRELAQKIREQSGIQRQPRGMMITQERLNILNKQSKKLFAVKITDLKNEKGDPEGTRVEINIHYKEV